MYLHESWMIVEHDTSNETIRRVRIMILLRLILQILFFHLQKTIP